MISYIDTELIGNSLKEARNLESELRDEINKLFDRFEKIPTETGEWIGPKAQEYFDIISEDKKQYTDFCDSITNQNNRIQSIIDHTEEIVRQY